MLDTSKIPNNYISGLPLHTNNSIQQENTDDSLGQPNIKEKRTNHNNSNLKKIERKIHKTQQKLLEVTNELAALSLNDKSENLVDASNISSPRTRSLRGGQINNKTPRHHDVNRIIPTLKKWSIEDAKRQQALVINAFECECSSYIDEMNQIRIMYPSMKPSLDTFYAALVQSLKDFSTLSSPRNEKESQLQTSAIKKRMNLFKKQFKEMQDLRNEFTNNQIANDARLAAQYVKLTKTSAKVTAETQRIGDYALSRH